MYEMRVKARNWEGQRVLTPLQPEIATSPLPLQQLARPQNLEVSLEEAAVEHLAKAVLQNLWQVPRKL